MPKDIKSLPNIQDSDGRFYILLVLLALLLPFVLLPLEKTILPYPVLVEEIFKALVIVLVILKYFQGASRYLAILLFSLVFSISENIFYLLNFTNEHSLYFYAQRFIWPLLMHLVTVFLLAFTAWRQKWFIIFGLLMSMALHYYYNNYLVYFLIN